MKKLNFMGIGPKIGGVALPWLAVAIFLTLKFKGTFAFVQDENRILFYSGLVLVIVGAIMYFLTVPKLLKGLKETKLVTSGTFYLCSNPLYASILLLIIPGLSLMMNSWLVLTASVAGIILFKIFIKSEYQEMENFFGENFREYRAETPEFLPFPVKKWFKSAQ